MHAAWLNVLWPLAPMGILAGAVFAWRHQRARDGKRVPVCEKLLRPPGESLRLRLAAIDDRLADLLLLFALLSLSLPAAIHTRPAQGELLGQLPTAALVAAMLGALAVLAIRLLRVAATRRNYQLGFNGERLVGELLNKLMLDGCHVFHDFPAHGIGNIDHVVVAPTGVFAVETKARRKGRARPGRRDHEVIYDGRRLQFPDVYDEEKLRQARRNAEWLSHFLTGATGDPVTVQPILTLPGWMVSRQVKDGLPVLNPKQIRGFILHHGGALGAAERQRILHKLDRQCRDVDF